MSARGQLSVQAIKGKFEQLQDVSSESNVHSGDPFPFRRPKTNFPIKDNYTQRDSFSFPANENVAAEMSDPLLTSTRLRSLSVGNSSSSFLNDKDATPKIDRNLSFKHQKLDENESVSYVNSMNFSNNNFASFAEKQRLVENIVMNIKNNAKRKEEEERKNKDFKAKDAFSITSKLEKDIKNVLERGTKLKWNSRSAKSYSEIDKNFPSKQDNLNSRKHEIGARIPPIKSYHDEGVNVELYPIRACISEDLDLFDDKKPEPIRSESSPDLLKKFNGISAVKLKTAEINSSVDINGDHSRYQVGRDLNTLSPSDMEVSCPFSNVTRKTSPVRPPRRRVKKKRAPPPPPLQSSDNAEDIHASNEKVKIFAASNTSTISFAENLEEPPIINTRINEKMLNSSCESNEFNYEEYCERTLEGEQFLFEKENNENAFNRNDSPRISPTYLDKTSSSRFIYSESSPDANVPYPDSPPKKPPRTFAHDIYRSLKSEKKEPLKLTAAEIESLYTKPLKRLKDKPALSTVPPLLPKPNDLTPKKPIIAPKPTDILTRSKKRFSVVEPTMSSEVKDALEKKPSIRRNSSFRFSFKRNKSVGSPLRSNIPKKETKIAKKIKTVARNWSPKRSESDKRVRFQSDSNEDNYNDESGGPIYATPNTHKQKKVKEQPKELHYLCSPLFKEDERSRESHKENQPPSIPNRGFNRFGLMDGLRQELRQSCRLVQKRLKSTGNDRRFHKGVAVVE